MKIIKTKLNDCYEILPDVFQDNRGFFLETFQLKRYKDSLNIPDLVQDNHSMSVRGVLRGLHFQKNKPQGKLVRVVKGSVYDVVVDIRKKSSTYGMWHSVILNEENKKQLWVPPGFAHGFLVLSDFADFEYKCSDYYDSSDEMCIKWDDPEIGIDWPIQDMEVIVSDKDESGLSINEI